MIELLIIVGMVIVGIYLRWMWLAAIGIALLIAYLFAATSKKARAPTGGKKPKIRPIIVKRRYDVESIYPSKMSIRLNPHYYTGAWWEFAQERLGLFAASMINWWRKR